MKEIIKELSCSEYKIYGKVNENTIDFTISNRNLENILKINVGGSYGVRINDTSYYHLSNILSNKTKKDELTEIVNKCAEYERGFNYKYYTLNVDTNTPYIKRNGVTVFDILNKVVLGKSSEDILQQYNITGIEYKQCLEYIKEKLDKIVVV